MEASIDRMGRDYTESKEVATTTDRNWRLMWKFWTCIYLIQASFSFSLKNDSGENLSLIWFWICLSYVAEKEEKQIKNQKTELRLQEKLVNRSGRPKLQYHEGVVSNLLFICKMVLTTSRAVQEAGVESFYNQQKIWAQITLAAQALLTVALKIRKGDLMATGELPVRSSVKLRTKREVLLQLASYKPSARKREHVAL